MTLSKLQSLPDDTKLESDTLGILKVDHDREFDFHVPMNPKMILWDIEEGRTVNIDLLTLSSIIGITTLPEPVCFF